MSSTVPPNISAAFRVFLTESSALRTYLGGDFVYTPEIPNGISGAGKRIAFRFNGGPPTDRTIPMRRQRVNVRCYGTSAQEAEKLYMQYHARIQHVHNELVTVGSEEVIFYGMHEDTPASHLEDPVTGWFYVFTVTALTVSTMAMA